MINSPWQNFGLCRSPDIDSEIFFPEKYKTNYGYIESSELLTKAKAVCAHCPVQRECFNHAMTFPERAGVWGGKSTEEREQIRKMQRMKRKN